MRGCDDFGFEGYRINDEIVMRCPKALYEAMPKEDKELISELMMTYFFLNKSVLPKAGGWKDQDRQIMSLMPTIGSFVERESLRKARAQANEKGLK